MDLSRLPQQAKIVINLWKDKSTPHRPVRVGEYTLTYTQYTVFILAVSGLTMKGMADALGRSPSTIDKHLDAVRQKLHARTINALTHIAIKNNLVIAGEFTQQ